METYDHIAHDRHWQQRCLWRRLLGTISVPPGEHQIRIQTMLAGQFGDWNTWLARGDGYATSELRIMVRVLGPAARCVVARGVVRNISTRPGRGNVVAARVAGVGQ